MTEIANGALPESAAKFRGRDFNDMLREDGPEAVCAVLESDSPADLVGAYLSEGAAPSEGELGDGSAVDAPNTSPRSWGFDVAEINRSYALAIFGGRPWW